MNWTENEILLNQNIDSAPKDVFQAVCDEIGKHYLNKGFKYARSTPKLTYKDKDIKFEIRFSSSSSNTRGESVSLNMFPSISSMELVKMKHKRPFILGVSTMLTKKGNWKNSNLLITETIFGEKIEHIDEQMNEPIFRYSNHCNVFGIDEIKFKKLIDFLNDKILIWITKIKTTSGIEEILQNKNYRTGYEIENSGLLDYFELIKKRKHNNV